MGRNSKTRENVGKKQVCREKQGAAADEFISGAQQRHASVRHSCHPRSHYHRSRTTLQSSQFLLENLVGGIGHTKINMISRLTSE
jgi:hypothetical protein